MNTKNEDLFKQRCKEYFDDKSNDLLNLINDSPKHGFFINEKKTNKDKIFELIDFNYQKSFNEKAFYIDTDNIGKTKAYELGIIYPQGIESSVSCSFIDTKNIKYSIDLCAAPGGKSINILNCLNDDVVHIANDVSYKRASILNSNLERLGFSNTIVTSSKPLFLAKKYQNYFDLVILDAPCSGEGMIRKYPEILDTYSIENINSLKNTQSLLLEDAYNLLNDGGQLLYSTCTFALEEDEEQIINFLDKHKDMSLINININETNYSKLDGTIKLCFLNNCEGQFIALMRKDNAFSVTNIKYLKETRNKIVEKFIKDNINIDNYYLYSNKDRYYLSLNKLIDIDENVLCEGIYIGEIKKDRFEPSHHLYRSNSLSSLFNYHYELNDKEYDDFVCGKELKISLDDNYYLLTYKGLSSGFGKCSKGILKNKYPKGLRKSN